MGNESKTEPPKKWSLPKRVSFLTEGRYGDFACNSRRFRLCRHRTSSTSAPQRFVGATRSASTRWHSNSTSEARLLATRIDLLDAFDDGRVEVEVVPQIADLDADIVLIASGVGISPQCTNRRDMGAMNVDLFHEIAEQCAARVPDSLFIVVSNPVELAVRILCEKLDRKRVVGMRAQQDSLRFARAIAKDLGVSRHQVRATVLGEHGLGMVPIWSSVELTTPRKEADGALETLGERAKGSAATRYQFESPPAA